MRGVLCTAACHKFSPHFRLYLGGSLARGEDTWVEIFSTWWGYLEIVLARGEDIQLVVLAGVRMFGLQF